MVRGWRFTSKLNPPDRQDMLAKKQSNIEMRW